MGAFARRKGLSVVEGVIVEEGCHVSLASLGAAEKHPKEREVEARVTTEGGREGGTEGGRVDGRDGLGWGLQGVLRGLVVWG